VVFSGLLNCTRFDRPGLSRNGVDLLTLNARLSSPFVIHRSTFDIHRGMRLRCARGKETRVGIVEYGQHARFVLEGM
jgi:hypothetical protein